MSMDQAACTPREPRGYADEGELGLNIIRPSRPKSSILGFNWSFCERHARRIPLCKCAIQAFSRDARINKPKQENCVLNTALTVKTFILCFVNKASNQGSLQSHIRLLYPRIYWNVQLSCADSNFLDFTARALGIHIIVMWEQGTTVTHFPSNTEHRLQLLKRGTPRTVVLSYYSCNPSRDEGHCEAVGLLGSAYPACTNLSIPDKWSLANETERQRRDDEVCAYTVFIEKRIATINVQCTKSWHV